MLDAVTDLLLGSCCLGCGRPGRLLCRGCETVLPGEGFAAWPTPCPAGLAPPWAAAEYSGTVRSLVLGLKEHRLLALARPLAALLAVSARCAVPPGGPVVLVPVPSRPASVRARGHDPTHALAAGAGVLLRREGYDVRSLRLLVSRPGVVDQAGLDATARAANLAGSMACPTASLRRLAARCPRASVVVCDDVLTTGATAREAQRALESVGLRVTGIAAVAATRRRSADPRGGWSLSSPPGTD